MEESDLEVLWLQVCPFKSKRNILIAAIYRPPNVKCEVDEKLAENIERVHMLNRETILMGDFNIDFLNCSYKKQRLVKALKDSKFTQLVTTVTRPASNSCLDHIWSNTPNRIVNIVCPEICISDHLPIFGVRLYKQCSSNNINGHKYIVYRNLKKLNEDEFLKTLHMIPWDSAFVFEEVDDVIDAWYHLLNDAINTHVPLIKKRIKNETQPKWFTSELLQLIKSRDEKLKTAKLSNSERDWFDLKRAKNKVTAAIRSAKKNYFHLSFQENRNDPKKLWSTIRNLTGKNIAANGPSFLEENGKQIRDRAEIAEIFSNHFSNLAKNLTADVNSEFNPTTVSDLVRKFKGSDDKLLFPDVSTQEVYDIIQAVPSDQATGTDGLSIKLLKIAAPAIIESLTKLINICIARGVFPTVWKEAKVTPLYKSGVKSDKNNYRPISVLPVISEVLERHLHNAIHTFLKNNNLYIDSNPALGGSIQRKRLS